MKKEEEFINYLRTLERDERQLALSEYEQKNKHSKEIIKKSLFLIEDINSKIKILKYDIKIFDKEPN